MQAWLRLTLVSRVLNLLDISGSMGERVPGTKPGERDHDRLVGGEHPEQERGEDGVRVLGPRSVDLVAEDPAAAPEALPVPALAAAPAGPARVKHA